MWSHDFCTVCDKQCPSGSMYCSDSCKSSDTNVAQVTQNNPSTLYTLRPKPLVPLSPEELFLDDHKDNTNTKTDNSNKPKSPTALPRTLAQSLPTQHCSPPTSDDDEDETYPEYNSHLMYRSPLLCATTKKVSGKKLSPPPSPLMMPSLAYNHQQMGQSVDAAGNYRRWLRS